MKEWECPQHGTFECTHPMCPEIGCEAECKQVFLTPPMIRSGFLTRFDAGIKKSVDMMGLGNLRSARGGEAAYGSGGNGMLWGTDAVQKALGVPLQGLIDRAATPMTVQHRDGHTETLNKSVMRELGQEGITRRRLPKPAELTGHRADRVKPKDV